MRTKIIKCKRILSAVLLILIIPIGVFSFRVKNADAVAYALVQAQYEFRASGAPHAFSSSNTAGNTIIVAAAWDTIGIPTISDTNGNSYTLAKMQTNPSPRSVGVWVAHNIVAGSNAVTLTLVGKNFDATYLEYSGLVSTDQVAGASGLGGTPSSGNTPTTTQVDEMVFGFVANNNSSPAVGSGFTSRANGVNNYYVRAEDKRVTPTGAYAATFGSVTGSWVAVAVTFKEAPSSTDTTAPTVPTGLSATAVSASQINLTWNTSTDNVAVTGYNVYRNGSLINTASGITYSDNGLSASTQYTYTVSAFDAAQNTSLQSTSVQATTLSSSDTTAPTVPTGLSATATSSSQINLTWNASTDNVAVTGYNIYRNGVLITTAPGTSYSNTGLAASTQYTYTVSAFDAAQNTSLQSSSAQATTQAGSQTAPAPGGFIEQSTSTTTRPVLTPSQIAQFMSTSRGLFTFPAPYNTQGYRITVPADCPGNTDCVNPVGYSYWRNMNNSTGSNTLYMFLGLSDANGGGGPTLFSLDKTSGVVTKVGPLFNVGDSRRGASGESWYFSATAPTTLYVHPITVSPILQRYDILSHVTSTVFDVTAHANIYGANRFIWQISSSNDDSVHAFSVRDSTTYNDLGCGVYQETLSIYKFYPASGQNYDECQIDRSGRYLMIKEQLDNRNGDDNRIIDLQTNVETRLLDENGAMGHSAMGFGWVVGADNWYSLSSAYKLWQLGTSPVGPGTLVHRDPSWSSESMQHVSWENSTTAPASSQYVCGSNADSNNGPRVNEVVCSKLDGSLNTLVVAPVMTDMNATGGGDSYSKLPKGNIDITGQYFIWTSNMGGNRLEAFVSRIPSQLLASSFPPPPDTTAPTVPTGLSATAVSASQINLTWNASTDNVAVTGYNIYRNTVLIATTPNTSYSSAGLAASTQYTYTVSAFDAAQNTSLQSASAQATTQAGVTSPYAFVQAQYEFRASGAPHAFTSPNTAGNTIIVAAAWNTSATPTISDTLGNIYTLAKQQGTVGVWVARNIRGGANAVTLTLSGQSFDATYLEYSGLVSTDQVAGASGLSVTANSGNTPTITQANEMVFGFIKNNNSMPSAGSGFTSRANGVNNYYVRAEDKRVTSIGQYFANSGTLTKKGSWVAVAITFKEASSFPPPPDTTAPTVPTGLSATAVSASQINLTWNASTDNVAVTGYNIYRNTVLIATTPNTSYSSAGLAASTQYTYTVSAFDAAQNTSLQSASAQATTQAGSPPPVVIGSAELPRVFIDTNYALPTGGTLWTPMNSLAFQNALNSSALGDVIQLQAGTTYTGPFTLPNKSGSGWIYIQSSAYAQLPAPNNRVFPSQANLMPKIVGTGFPVIALQTATAAHNYRFVGIEFLPQSGLFASSLIRLGTGSETQTSDLPYNLVFDRTYVHGDPTIGGRRGIALNSNTTSIIDSYFSNWKEVGADSQAIAGWNGAGPYKIVNNYLEAAGENIIFGGADVAIPNLVSADIEVRGNHFFKPFAWRNQSWTVKNLFELKNAERVLIDGNIFENMWAAAQSTAINLKAADDSGLVPWAVQQDVTFSNNIIRHVSEGIKFCIKACDTFPTQPGGRITVANNLFYDINSVTYGGNGRFISVILDPIPNLVIDHNTVIHNGDTGIVDSTGPSSSPGFIFTNNITAHGTYGFKGSGAAEGNGTLATFFPGAVFTKNILQGTSGASALNYPAGNYYPTTYANVGFVNQAADDYHLASGSLYKNVGTDGADLGADISLIETRTSCVISGLCEGSMGVQSITRTLRVGSSGDDVKVLQSALGITADGIFGPATEAAVKAFQIKSGLVADGVFGPQTRAALI